jgi:Mg2+/Co2+ transporter CorB
VTFVEISPTVLLVLVGVLAILSAYFSGTETAMMALNRYRLRHLVQQGHRGARRASDLLARPDRLLGVILIGNNLVNNMAATVATVIGLELFGDTGVALAPIVITLLFLVVSEVAPKTLAAHRPEPIAYACRTCSRPSCGSCTRSSWPSIRSPTCWCGPSPATSRPRRTA